jgi:hypothetical protein
MKKNETIFTKHSDLPEVAVAHSNKFQVVFSVVIGIYTEICDAYYSRHFVDVRKRNYYYLGMQITLQATLHCIVIVEFRDWRLLWNSHG